MLKSKIEVHLNKSKTMKKLFILSFIISFSILFSQSDSYTNSVAKFDGIKVYYRGAMIKQSFTADISKGNTYIFVENFGREYLESLEISADRDVSIISLEKVYSNSSKWTGILEEKKFKSINDSTSTYSVQRKNLEKELEIIENSKAILKKNQEVNKGSTDEIVKLIDFNKVKLKELFQEEQFITNRIKSLDTKIRNLDIQKNEIYKTWQSKNLAVFYVSSTKNQKVKFNISYFDDNVNWRPIYRLESEGITSSMKLRYKAQITQNTGLNWKDAPITLIGTEFNNDFRPYELERLFLNVERGESYNNQAFQKNNTRDSRTASVAEVSVVGNTVRQKMLKTEIELDKNTYIPSASKGTTIDINTFDIKTEYNYFTTPKLDTKTFLLAYIDDYSKYNLLPGTADVFIEGTKVGSAQIDPSQFSSKMIISLGNDPNVITKRNLISYTTENSGEKTKTEKYEYEITIKNNKSSAINLEVKDQIPLSTDATISIQLLNPDKGELQSESGFLTWKLNLKAGETRVIKFGFVVTLPKEMRITNLR